MRNWFINSENRNIVVIETKGNLIRHGSFTESYGRIMYFNWEEQTESNCVAASFLNLQSVGYTPLEIHSVITDGKTCLLVQAHSDGTLLEDLMSLIVEKFEIEPRAKTLVKLLQGNVKTHKGLKILA